MYFPDGKISKVMRLLGLIIIIAALLNGIVHFISDKEKNTGISNYEKNRQKCKGHVQQKDGMVSFDTVVGYRMSVPDKNIGGTFNFGNFDPCEINRIALWFRWNGEDWVNRIPKWDGDKEKFRGILNATNHWPYVSIVLNFSKDELKVKTISADRLLKKIELDNYPVSYYPLWKNHIARYGYLAIDNYEDEYGRPFGFECANSRFYNTVKNDKSGNYIKVKEYRYTTDEAKEGYCKGGLVTKHFYGRLVFDTSLIPVIDKAYPRLIEKIKSLIVENRA